MHCQPCQQSPTRARADSPAPGMSNQPGRQTVRKADHAGSQTASHAPVTTRWHISVDDNLPSTGRILKIMNAATVPTAPDGQPILTFATQDAFKEWLGAEYERPDGIWLRLAKKGSDLQTLTYADAVEVALCFGWIDSQARGYDDESRLQRFTRRRARSPWSQVNRAKVERLIEEGRMQPAGQAEIDRAKTDGRWERAYEPPSTATVPDDLRAALNAAPAASAAFDNLTSRHRFSVLYRIQDAKRPETRARRIEKYVGMLAEGKPIS